MPGPLRSSTPVSQSGTQPITGDSLSVGCSMPFFIIDSTAAFVSPIAMFFVVGCV
jgi:hypothetical protein